MNVEFNRNEDQLKQLSYQLRQKFQQVSLGGGEKRIAAHKAKGKLTARERIDYLLDKGAVTVRPDGRFEIDFAKIKGAVTDLTHELLTLEAEGDYERAKKMLTHYVEIRPAMAKMLANLESIPTDVWPL